MSERIAPAFLECLLEIALGQRSMIRFANSGEDRLEEQSARLVGGTQAVIEVEDDGFDHGAGRKGGASGQLVQFRTCSSCCERLR